MASRETKHKHGDLESLSGQLESLENYPIITKWSED